MTLLIIKDKIIEEWKINPGNVIVPFERENQI